MAANTPLPMVLASTARRTRARRATAGERAPKKRVTSFAMQVEDELVLDALRASYGTEVTGEAIRRALREAATSRGIDVASLNPEATAA